MRYKGKTKELSQGFKNTTNNRMELMAVIEAIKALNEAAKDKEIIIYTDSKYVKDAIDKGWIHHWVKIGFKDKANPDLWRKYMRISRPYNIRLEWVKGHSGIAENERCDQLAKAAAKKENLKEDSGYRSKNQLF